MHNLQAKSNPSLKFHINKDPLHSSARFHKIQLNFGHLSKHTVQDHQAEAYNLNSNELYLNPDTIAPSVQEILHNKALLSK